MASPPGPWRSKQGFPEESLLATTLVLLYIHDLPENILRSFVNIYADDSTIYRRTSKNIDDQRLGADLSFNITFTSQCEKKIAKYI